MWLVTKAREHVFSCCFILRIGHAHGLMSDSPTIGEVSFGRFNGHMGEHAVVRI